MMQSLEAACDDGERAVKRLKAIRAAVTPLLSPREDHQQPHASPFDFDVKPAQFDLFEELQKLYDDEDNTESCSDSEDENVQYKSMILEKLVQRERLNTVILKLYPGNKGYSLAFRTHNKSNMYSEELIETPTSPYEEDTLFKYLDNEEIPPYILDVLDQYEHLFYSGCVILEVRDFRWAFPSKRCDIHHILLRPTQKTLMADINNLTKDRPDMGQEEKDMLESQLVLAHTPDLCLDLDPYIENDMARIHNRKHLWNTHQFRRIARKFSQVTVNRKRKLETHTHMHGLKLYDYIKAKRGRSEIHVPSFSRDAHNVENKTVAATLMVPNLEPPASLVAPSQPIKINELKALNWPEDTRDCSPQLMEEYILETDMPSKDKNKPRVYHIKLSIFQRPSSLEFLGELYLDRDHKKDERNGVACRFSLGSRPNAHRYVRQFTEIFTESGRKAARIKCGAGAAVASRGPLAVPVPPPAAQVPPAHPREHINQLLQVQTQPQPILNGTLQSAAQTVLNMPNHIQTNVNAQKIQQLNPVQEREVNALATKFMNYAEQFQAENAKQQQQKLLANSNIINLLNSSPASSVNSDASAAVVNAINSTVVPQHRILARKRAFGNVTAGTRLLNHHGNLITLNNNRVSLSAQLGQQTASQTVTLTPVSTNNRVNLNDLSTQLSSQQPQAVTLTSMNNGSYNFAAIPVKQQMIHQRISNMSSSSSSEGSSGCKSSSLSALLVGTPSADRPDIGGGSSTANSLLLEKLAAGSGGGASQSPFAQPPSKAQFVVQSPKGSTAVLSPMSSPPPAAAQTTGTLNVSSLNLSQLQSISGLQNVQVQIPGFAQPIPLTLNVGGQMTGQASAVTNGLQLVSLPAGVATQTQPVVTQGSQQQTVQGIVLNTSGTSQIAHLVSSGSIKNISHQNLRASPSGSQTVQLTPGSPQFQLLSQLQRQNRQQNLLQPTQGGISPRTVHRTPITIKMASNSTSQANLETIQQYQQLCINQQKGLDGVFERLRRSSGEQQ